MPRRYLVPERGMLDNRRNRRRLALERMLARFAVSQEVAEQIALEALRVVEETR